MKWLLEKYIVLKILSKYPEISRYMVYRLMCKLDVSCRIATLYSLFRELEKEGLICSVKKEVPVKTLNELLRISKMDRKTKSDVGWFKRKTKKVSLYSLTEKGKVELVKMECKIKNAMNVTCFPFVRDSYLLERYLILKMLKYHKDYTSWDLMVNLRKLGYSIARSSFERLIKKMLSEELIQYSVESKYEKRNIHFVYITDKGLKSLMDYEKHLRVALFSEIH